LNTHYTYFVILAASLAGPLALSFDKKVAFYKSWKYLFPAMLLPAIFYITWDIFFTHYHIWSFNEKYITGIKLYNLPVEEVLFFFVVPYCCTFIYECIRIYFPLLKRKPVADRIFQLLAIVLFVTGVVCYRQYYTAYTFIFTALFISILYLSKKLFATFDAAVFLTAYAVTLIPFLIVNGFLTALPVVLYNDTENLGIRICTIPVEDIFYGMLLVAMNIALYEKFKNRNVVSN